MTDPYSPVNPNTIKVFNKRQGLSQNGLPVVMNMPKCNTRLHDPEQKGFV
jgi:hypothetical protein